MVRKAVSIKTAVYMDKASRFSVWSKLLMSLREPLALAAGGVWATYARLMRVIPKRHI